MQYICINLPSGWESKWTVSTIVNLCISCILKYLMRQTGLICGQSQTENNWRPEKYLVFLEKLGGNDPGCVSDDLVHVSTVSDRLVPLPLCEYCVSLRLVGEFVAANCDMKTRSLLVSLSTVLPGRCHLEGDTTNSFL